MCVSCLAMPPADSAAATESMAVGAVFAIPEALLAPSVTAPASANMGSARPGQTMTVQLGQVKVNSSGTMTWTATVSASTFTTGGRTPAETISPGNLTYWSGPVVTKSGPGSYTPGQPAASNAVALSSARTAFSYTTVNVLGSSVVWQPTLTMSVPATAVSGTYSGTVTHSVA